MTTRPEIYRKEVAQPQDAIAFPLKHPIYQDIPICVVTLKAGIKVSERELLGFAAERLGARGPKRIVALEKIPRNDHGKVMRQQLIREISKLLRSPNRPRKHDAK